MLSLFLGIKYSVANGVFSKIKPFINNYFHPYISYIFFIFFKYSVLSYSSINFRGLLCFWGDFKKPLTYIFWKFYWNNRPRINVFYPTYFFTIGLLQHELKLPNRQLSRRSFKIIFKFWEQVIIQPYLIVNFNYFNTFIFFFINLLLQKQSIRYLNVLTPHHLYHHYKYKKYKSIKKWVKKKFYPVQFGF